MPEWSNGAVSKTVVPFMGTKGSNPFLSAYSVLIAFTGFAVAALIDCIPTAANAMTNVTTAPAIRYANQVLKLAC